MLVGSSGEGLRPLESFRWFEEYGLVWFWFAPEEEEDEMTTEAHRDRAVGLVQRAYVETGVVPDSYYGNMVMVNGQGHTVTIAWQVLQRLFDQKDALTERNEELEKILDAHAFVEHSHSMDVPGHHHRGNPASETEQTEEKKEESRADWWLAAVNTRINNLHPANNEQILALAQIYATLALVEAIREHS